MKKLAIFLLSLYKNIISPVFVLNFGHACRFTPTCSVYTKEAIERHGMGKGLFLGFKRFLRCHPFSNGHFDPVPN